MGLREMLSAIVPLRTSARGPAALSAAALAGPAGDWRRAEPSFAPATPSQLKGYMAASNDRLVADLMASLGGVSGNAEVRMAMRDMRRRSRQLANDNEYVKRFLQLVRNNVAGPRGFDLQSKIYKARRVDGLAQLDRDANALIEEAYAEFSRPGVFSADGRMSRGAFERGAITGLARDGELLIECCLGARFGRFGMAWRLLDPDLLDDELNVGINGVYPGWGRLPQGNSIRMGVEQDPFGRPQAYWLLQRHPFDDVVGSTPSARHRRVPADMIIHWFVADEMRPDTSRGVPWIYSAIRRMAMLGGYEEAALVNARAGASKMGFYKPPPTEPSAGGGLADGTPVADLYDERQGLMMEADPGSFGVLPPGWGFEKYDPAYPNDAMEGFIKAMLRAFSAGTGLTYNTLASDLQNVSLSAMRHGANTDRDTYEAIQDGFREHVAARMFSRWLEIALLAGQVGRLPVDAVERLNRPRFVARPFRSPDPQKDIAAHAQAVALGVRSRTRICAEAGEDFEEVLEELAREEQMARDKGVTLNTEAATAHKTPAVDDAGKPPKPAAGAAPQEDDTE